MLSKCLDPDGLVKARLRQLSQPVRIIGIGLVERLVQNLLRVPRLDADRRHPLGCQDVIEPCRQRACFEDDPPGTRGVLPDCLSQKLGVRRALARQTRLPSRRIEIAVSFNETSSPIY